jgi:hypothetical protein
MSGPPVLDEEPAARFRSVVAHSALVGVAPLSTLVALALVGALALFIAACSRHSLILALLLLLPLHLLGRFLRRFLRLFSHLHSVLSEVIYIRLTPIQ